MIAAHHSVGLAPLPTKCSDDAHAAERFRDQRIDFFTLSTHASVLRTNPANPGFVSQKNNRHDHDRAEQQSPVNQREDHQRSNQLNDRLPRVVNQPEQQIPDALRVLPNDARRAARLQFLHSMQRQPDGVFERLLANSHSQQHRNPSRMPAAPDMNSDLEKRKQQNPDRRAKQQSAAFLWEPCRKTRRQRFVGQHVVNHKLRRRRRHQRQPRRQSRCRQRSN